MTSRSKVVTILLVLIGWSGTTAMNVTRETPRGLGVPKSQYRSGASTEQPLNFVHSDARQTDTPGLRKGEESPFASKEVSAVQSVPQSNAVENKPAHPPNQNRLFLTGVRGLTSGAGNFRAPNRNTISARWHEPSPNRRTPVLPQINLTIPYLNRNTSSRNENTSLPNHNSYSTNGTTTSFSGNTTSSSWPVRPTHAEPSSNQMNFSSVRTTPFIRQSTRDTTEPRDQVRELYGCRKLSPYVCETEDGARMDLTPLANTNNTPRFSGVTDPASYVYAWNPCYSFSQQQGCYNVALCQTAVRTTSWGYYNLGTQDSADFLVSSNRGLMLQYTGQGGSGDLVLRTSYVQLRCDPDVEGEFTAHGETMKLSGVYYFTLTSRHVCLSGGGQPTSPSPTPIPTSVTPTPDPIYSLKTVVDLLFFISVIAGIALLVLTLVLAVLCVRRSRSAASYQELSSPPTAAAATTRAGPAHKFSDASGTHAVPELFYTVSNHASWVKN